MIKICSKCGEFREARKRGICMECMSKINRIYYVANMDRMRAQNRAAGKVRNRNYRLANPLPPRKTLTERVADHIPKHLPSDECWPWLKIDGTYSKSYGYIRDGRKKVRATHAVLNLHGIIVPIGLVVLHSCDNPPCVNPKHLSIGTHADNVSDKVAKGRGAFGALNGRAKLSEDSVRDIRNKSKHMSMYSIAKEYSMDQKSIKLIVTRKTWKHIV